MNELENGEPRAEITDLQAEVGRLSEIEQQYDALVTFWAANMSCSDCPIFHYCNDLIGADLAQAGCEMTVKDYARHVVQQTKGAAK